ncbi:MAG: MMPL family transporter [Solirubrobacteraceae bacterium]|nr:MMPL family transporter [Patulibacter sp.]
MGSTFAAFTIRHRRAIALVWVVLAVAGGWAASTLSGHLSQATDAPGKPAFKANAAILERFGSGGGIAPIVAVGTPEQTATLRRVGAAVEDSRTVVGGPGLTSADGRTVVALIFPPPGPGAPDENAPALAAAVAAAHGTGVEVTGQQALTKGADSGGAGLLVETLLGGVGALVVLIAVFASPLAFVPILLAAVSILTTFLVLRGLAAAFEISFVVQFFVGLIGLGVAIDYSLLFIVRWREERARGADPEEAVHRAVVTAGHAILVSGTTVGIGLIAMAAVPVAFIRSIGLGGLLIPLVSVIASLTLLPGLLTTIGPRLDRRRTTAVDVDRDTAWTRWSRMVVGRRWPAAILGLVVTGALAAAALSLNPGQPSLDALASNGTARDGLQRIERSGLGSGTLTPIEALVPVADIGTARQRLEAVDGVHAVLAPADPAWQAGGMQAVAILPEHDAATSAGKDTLNAVRDLHSGTLLIGGAAAQVQELTDAIYSSFPVMFAVISILTFLLLWRSLRSVVLPVKAILLNLLSVAASFGVVVLVWQEGHGSHLLAGLPGTGAVTNWVPLAMFAFLYGLSMDYEVFILSRMREEYDRTGSTDEAVIQGLGRTGRLVTSAALILFLAFVALGAGPQTDLKILATGLAAGIILDATVVRALIVPALVSLMGEANWWTPGRRDTD